MKRSFLFLTLLAGTVLTGCTQDSSSAVTKAPDAQFIDAQMQFSVDLFQESVRENQNVLISPFSASLALAMTANGASGSTLSQMEAVLGNGMPMEEMNACLAGFSDALPSSEASRLTLANSLWLREDYGDIQESFLQINKAYYHADVFREPFTNQTCQKINSWADKHTDGQIRKVADMIPSDAVIYLINALVFDGNWQEAYTDAQVKDGIFYADTEQEISMMNSIENTYLSDGNAVGFIKPYEGGAYSFAALMPEEMPLSEYIAALDARTLADTLSHPQNCTVYASLPRFSNDGSYVLNEMLIHMGMSDAFSETQADFSRMAESSENMLYIDTVLQKTHIDVNEQGTKAGAVTAVEVDANGCIIEDVKKTVTLDHPFLYMIIDNQTGIPLFMGTVNALS